MLGTMNYFCSNIEYQKVLTNMLVNNIMISPQTNLLALRGMTRSVSNFSTQSPTTKRSYKKKNEIEKQKTFNSIVKPWIKYQPVNEAVNSKTLKCDTEDSVSNENVSDNSPLDPLTFNQYHGPRLTYYESPLGLTYGRMQYVFDSNNKKYLDCFGGSVLCSIGHSHPLFVERLSRQLEKIAHTGAMYFSEHHFPYTKRLAESFSRRTNQSAAYESEAETPDYVCPRADKNDEGSLNQVYLVNSAGEANDLAVLLCRLYTGSNAIIAMENDFHGATYLASSMNGMNNWRYNVTPVAEIIHASFPSVRRCLGTVTDPVDYFGEELQGLIRRSTTGRVAGFFHETIQGVGGVHLFPEGCLKKAYEIVRAHGGLCVANEAHAGFGRTGSVFWGFEAHGVTPDIVTVSEGLGNGFPMAAVVTSREILSLLKDRLHLNSLGGGPLACLAGKTVLDVIERDSLQANCAYVGGHLKKQLLHIGKNYNEFIGDVRGHGLIFGLEVIENGNILQPSKKVAKILQEKLRSYGILVGRGGYHMNVIRITPPMCFTIDDANHLVDALKLALEQLLV